MYLPPILGGKHEIQDPRDHMNSDDYPEHDEVLGLSPLVSEYALTEPRSWPAAEQFDRVQRPL